MRTGARNLPMREEETAGLGFEYVEFNWWEEDLLKTVSQIVKGKIGCDMPLAGAENVDTAIACLRPTLTRWEVDRFESLGKDTSVCMEQTCREIAPGMSELEVAARLLQKLYPLNIRAAVLLVGADERVLKYRHPVATAKKIEKYAMIIVCAERGGLIVPTTRLVHFGPLPPDLKRRYSALRKVAAVLNLSSRPGTTIGSALAAAVKGYEEAGFAGEWKNHYQGGVCGYAAREVNASPGGTFSFAVNQVLGWNPTITGTKIEDAFVIGKDELRNITLTPSWPSSEEKVAEGAITLPDILKL